MISIYTTAFYLKRCNFNYNFSLTNFCKFADQNGEVIVAVPNLPDDDSFELLLNWRNNNKEISQNLHIYFHHLDIHSPLFESYIYAIFLLHQTH